MKGVKYHMKASAFCGLLVSTAVCLAAPIAAQDQAEVSAPAQAVADAAMDAATTAAADPVAPPAAEPVKPCELHVWPTENYLGIKMGLLSGFGVVGAVADHAANKKAVTNVKSLMRDYLGPDVQLAELEQLDYMGKLELPRDQYRVVMHEPTPWNEDLKNNPELKAKVKELNRKIKAGERVTDSTNPCYAELITTHIFYHKAMMYGSNLFTGWSYRRFDGNRLVAQNAGQVKNPLEHFPPRDETMVEAAKAELRDAYTKDFVEWVQKKSGV